MASDFFNSPIIKSLVFAARCVTQNEVNSIDNRVNSITRSQPTEGTYSFFSLTRASFFLSYLLAICRFLFRSIIEFILFLMIANSVLNQLEAKKDDVDQAKEFFKDFEKRKATSTYVYADVIIQARTSEKKLYFMYMTIHPFYDGFFITNYFNPEKKNNILFIKTYKEYFASSSSVPEKVFGSIRLFLYCLFYFI